MPKKKPGRFIVCRARHHKMEDERFGTTDVLVVVLGHPSVFAYSIVMDRGALEGAQVYPCGDLKFDSVQELLKVLEAQALEHEKDLAVTCREELSLGDVQHMVHDDFSMIEGGARAMGELVGCFSSVAA